MTTPISYFNKYKILLLFFAIYLYGFLPNLVLNAIGITVPEYINKTSDLTVFSILLILFKAFVEEFIFRYLLSLRGWFTALWTFFLIFISTITLNPFLNSDNIYNFIIIYVLSASVLMYALTFLKKSTIYKALFTPSLFKITVSLFTFCIIHVTNYNTSPFSLWFILYILFIYLPFSIYLTFIRLSYKHGFWIATGFHFLYNIFTTVLTLIFR